MISSRSIILFLFLGLVITKVSGEDKFLGPLKQYHHGVKGDVYIVDDNHLRLEQFHYDGNGPDAFFIVGKTDKPRVDGEYAKVGYPDPGDTSTIITRRPFNGETIQLELPSGYHVPDIAWFSVYCIKFNSNFADIYFPAANSGSGGNNETLTAEKGGQPGTSSRVSGWKLLTTFAILLPIPRFSLIIAY